MIREGVSGMKLMEKILVKWLWVAMPKMNSLRYSRGHLSKNSSINEFRLKFDKFEETILTRTVRS